MQELVNYRFYKFQEDEYHMDIHSTETNIVKFFKAI